jgi:hypothetical protein
MDKRRLLGDVGGLALGQGISSGREFQTFTTGKRDRKPTA